MVSSAEGASVEPRAAAITCLTPLLPSAHLIGPLRKGAVTRRPLRLSGAGEWPFERLKSGREKPPGLRSLPMKTLKSLWNTFLRSQAGVSGADVLENDKYAWPRTNFR